MIAFRHWLDFGVNRRRRLAALAGEEGVERIKLLEGWSRRRFTAASWPGNDAFVYLIDGRARVVSAWLIALALLIGWVLCRRPIEKLSWHYLGLVVFMIASLLVGWVLPSRYASYAWGLFGGGLLVLVVELGMGLSRYRESPRRRTESSLLRRAAPAALATGLLGLLVVRVASGQGGIGPRGGGPMVVLFPYEEDKFDPRRPPQTAIVRLADFEQLSRLAAAEDRGPRSCVRAVSAVHRILKKTDRAVLVETEHRSGRVRTVALGVATTGLGGSGH